MQEEVEISAFFGVAYWKFHLTQVANLFGLQNLVLGRFGGASSSRKAAGRRRPEDRVLKSTEGNFRNGVLDVKQLLKPSAPKASFDDGKKPFSSGKGKKKKKGGKKNKGKKNKGGGPGKKRH